MVNGKKALTVSTVISFILGLLMLIVLTYILWSAYDNWRANVEVCPGECRDRCILGAGETQFANTCFKEGMEKPDRNRVCCVTSEDLRKTREDESEDELTGEITTQRASPSIEVRQGESVDRISWTSSQRLNVGTSYVYHLWGFGVDEGRCIVEMLDSENNLLAESHNMAWLGNRELCVDDTLNENVAQRNTRDGRNNYLTNKFEPEVNDAGQYTLQVRLINSDGVQIQSIRMPFIVFSSPQAQSSE